MRTCLLRFSATVVAFVLITFLPIVGLGQQIIGSFPSQDGGFEGQTAGSLSTTSSTTAWWLSASITGSVVSTGGRSGPKYSNISMSGTSHRTLRGPAIETFAAATSYVIQFYYKGDKNNDGTSDFGDIRGGINGSAFNYGAYTTNSNTGSTWTKYTAAVTPGAATSTGHSVISIVEIASKTADFDIDDVVIYLGSSADNAAPNSPGTVTVNNATASSLDVSWGAASGGVDGGGYVVVRYAVSPNADNDPNQNGIYAVGNTHTNGTGSLTGTVRYIGTGTSFTDNVGLSAGTTYYYKVYTVDKAFNYSAETSGNGATTGGCTAPTTAAGTITPSNITINSADYSFTRGDGDGGVLVVARLNATSAVAPTSNTTYTANTVFGSGDITGTGNFVVYNGTAAGINAATGTLSISNLAAGNTYVLTAYEYNSTGTCYNISSPGTGNVLTIPPAPTAAAASPIASTSFTANWGTATGAASYRIDVSTASDFSSFVSGWEDVTEAGTSRNVNSNISAATTYYYRVRAVNASGTSASSSNITVNTPATTPSAVTGLTVGTRTASTIALSWTAGGGTGRIVVARLNATGAVVPTAGTAYTPSVEGSFTGSTTTGTGNIVVYNGTGTSVTVTDLSAATAYAFDVYEYDGTGVYRAYAAAATTGSTSTLATEPTTQANTVNITAITATGFTIGWTNGNGAGRIVLVKSGSAVDSDPVDGTTYTANTAFGSGTQIGTGNYVVFASTSNTVNVTGLSTNTTYHVAVYEYNGSATTINYRLTPATSNAATAVTIATQDFEASPATPTLGYTGTGETNSTTNKFIGAVSYRMAGSTNFISDNVNISAYNNVSVTGYFAGLNVDSGEDLFIELSYNNGSTWETPVQIGDGTSNFSGNITDAHIAARAPQGNPFSIAIPSDKTQVKIRITTNTIGASEYFYIDNITVLGAYKTTSDATNYFRSKATGNWNTAGTWQSSYDNSYWIDATVVPGATSEAVTIRNGHTVTQDVDVTIGASKTLTMQATSALIVASGKVLTVTGSADFAGQSVTFKSDNTGTAALGNSGTISNATNVTVERFIPGKAARKWSFLASPVTQTISNGWQQQIFITGVGTGGTLCTQNSPFNGVANSNGFDVTQSSTPTMYYYNSTQVNGSRWVSVANTNATSLTPGVGYRLNIRGNRTTTPCDQLTSLNPAAPDNVTLSATGTLTTGTVSGVAINNNGSHNYALIGNPYASAINFASFKASNSNISDKFWTYSPTNVANTYCTYSAGSVTGFGPTGYSTTEEYRTIASGQSFFVEGNNTGGSTVSFSENHKSTDVLPNNNFFRTYNWDNRIRINYLTAASSYVDDILVRFSNESGVTYAAGELDAISFNSGTMIAARKGTSKFAIQTRPLSFTNDTVKLSVASTTQASYKLVFSEYDQFTTAAQIVLRDKFLNIEQDVKVNNSYAFNVTADAASQGDNRFELVFKTATTLPVNFLGITAVKKNGAVEVSWTVAQETNLSGYQVERSTTGSNFSTIATVTATGANKYNTVDNSNVSGTVYYRIKTIERSGTGKYSAVVKLNLNSKGETVSVYPNPVREQVQLLIANGNNGLYSVRIITAAGKEVWQQSGLRANGQTMTIATHQLTAGNYLLALTNANGETTVAKFVKQ